MVVANVTYVGQFQYLGSIMTDDGEVDAKVDKHLANASKAFGALRQGVFGDHNLSIAIKRRIYNTYVFICLVIWCKVLDTFMRALEPFKYILSTIIVFTLHWALLTGSSWRNTLLQRPFGEDGDMQKQ